ncbi:MAG TPA: hypothetical protein PK522_11180, partial [Nitrosomonas sp.]|nr:hypothetical protein [Nitrosomonas sp.]
RLIEVFWDDEDVEDQIQEFIDYFNKTHNPPAPIVKSSNPDVVIVIDDLLNQFVSNGNNFNIIDLLFQEYLNLTNDFGDVFRKIEINDNPIKL